MKNANVMLAAVFGLVLVLFGIALFSQVGSERVNDPEVAAPGELPMGDAVAGETLARLYCASCHDVDGRRPSPQAEAPRFGELVRRWPVEYLAEALAEGITVTSHEQVEMPEFAFEPEEIDDLLAYMDSLK